MSILPDQSSPRRAWPWVLVLALTYFACLVPTLRWLEFSNGIENLNIATVLEIHRNDGPWLLPTLEGKPRVEKPPLTAWITATAAQRTTTAALDDPDPARRNAAYQRLATEARWTAVLTAAFTLFATYAFGTTVAGARIGLIAAIACASNFFFVRFTRFATTDVQLTLWVTIANVFIARCVLNRVTWPAALGAGASLGVAFMAKGPVALVQTIVPAIVFMLIARRRRSTDEPRRRIAWPPIIVSAIVMLAIASWWFIIVAVRVPGVMTTWLSETNPAGGDRRTGNNFFAYAVIIPFIFPWTALLVHGVIAACVTIFKDRGAPDRSARLRTVYPTVLLLATILIMSCFQDRKDRYLIPMVPVACVIVAQSAAMMLDRIKNALPDWSHWAMLIGFALAPLLGMTPVVKTIDGGRWFSPAFAISATGVALVIVVVGMLASRRVRFAMILAPFVMMMFLQAIGIHGYSKSREGRSDMRPLAEFIRANHPTAEMFNHRAEADQKRAPSDLSIYLNRATVLVPDPATLPQPTDRPQIYVQLQRRNEPEPKPSPGWTYLHKVRRDRDWYHAFVRTPGLAGE